METLESKSVDKDILISLEGAQIQAGADYAVSDQESVYQANVMTNGYDASCDRCDCVCNQPCHGEGPCYSL